MSRNARIEEIEESDSDPSEVDVSELDATSIIRPADIPQPGTKAPAPSIPMRQQPTTMDKEKYKNWQSLYPVYFDIGRSRAKGRRVGKELAVENPLAREIAQAAGRAGLQVVFEPNKTHPKDWANPGRVRVHLKENGMLKNPRIKNSKHHSLPFYGQRGLLTAAEHHLYIMIGEHLKANPTTQESTLRYRIPGMPPPPDKPIPPPAIPRGWKMGTILPQHSPALSGGGVSENMFKEMMQEMQGGGSAGELDAPSSSGEGKKKKEKKNIKA
ncbi:signal recognition particle subunit [Agyrium rufum]|nr:signal recognition particle subunit [Agyrium rufum]